MTETNVDEIQNENFEESFDANIFCNGVVNKTSKKFGVDCIGFNNEN